MMRDRRRSCISLTILFFAGLPNSANAQDGEAWPTGTLYPYVGFAFGVGSVPGSFKSICHDGWDGHRSATALEAHVGLAKDRIGVGVRAVRFGEYPFEASNECLVPDPVGPDGVHTIRTSAHERTSFTLVDLRLRYALIQGPITWLFLIGPGWVPSADVIATAVGSSVRFGRLVRGTVDLEWLAYRTPWDELIGEWRDFEIVREIQRIRSYDWRSGTSIRLGIELPIRR